MTMIINWYTFLESDWLIHNVGINRYFRDGPLFLELADNFFPKNNSSQTIFFITFCKLTLDKLTLDKLCAVWWRVFSMEEAYHQ